MKSIILLLPFNIILTALIAVNTYAAHYSYDDMGRISVISYEQSGSVTYKYDISGNITRIITAFDTDNDGMPDGWEIANNLDYMDDKDASQDADNDGFTNYQEYYSDTDPQNNHGFHWIMTGSASWFVQNTTYNTGKNSLQSGEIDHSEQSSIETRVKNSSMVRFYWKVSSELNNDYLTFYIDDIEMASISGEIEWHKKEFSLSPGEHVLRWSYKKNNANSQAKDAGWIDDIKLSPLSIIPMLYLLQ